MVAQQILRAAGVSLSLLPMLLLFETGSQEEHEHQQEYEKEL